jgi:hypothetical protein
VVLGRDPALGFAPQNILRVRDWLGHSSVEETERYAHVNSVNAGGMLDALGAAVVAKNGNARHSVSLTEASAR